MFHRPDNRPCLCHSCLCELFDHVGSDSMTKWSIDLCLFDLVFPIPFDLPVWGLRLPEHPFDRFPFWGLFDFWPLPLPVLTKLTSSFLSEMLYWYMPLSLRGLRCWSSGWEEHVVISLILTFRDWARFSLSLWRSKMPRWSWLCLTPSHHWVLHTSRWDANQW